MGTGALTPREPRCRQHRAQVERRETDRIHSLLTPGQPRLFPLGQGRERDPPARDLQLQETSVASTSVTGGQRRTHQQVDAPGGFRDAPPAKPRKPPPGSPPET